MKFEVIKVGIIPGLIFEKPRRTSTILKVDEKGFTYSIGNNGNSKKVTFDMLEQCYMRLQETGSFNRSWFKATFPEISKQAPCSFTTIGGILQHTGIARYETSMYIKKEV